jgi:hypothetical protein
MLSFGSVMSSVLLSVIPTEIDSADPVDQESPALSCDQNSCSVIWNIEDYSRGDESLGLRWLYRDGGSTAVSTSSRYFANGSAVWNGRTFFVADRSGYAGDQRVYLFTSDSSGQPLSTLSSRVLGPNRAGSQGARRVGFAATAQTGLLAWTGNEMGFNRIQLRRLNADGGYLDPNPVSPLQGANFVQLGDVVERGGRFYVLFFDRIDRNQYDPYLSVWDETGPVAEQIPLALTPSSEYQGTFAVSGAHLLATWGGDQGVKLGRFSFDGGRLTAPIVLPSASSPGLSMHGNAGFFGAVHSLIDGGSRLEIDVLTDDDAGINLTSVFEQDAVRTFALAAQDVGVSWAAIAALSDAGVSRVQVLRLDLNLLRGAGGIDGGGIDAGGIDAGGIDAGGIDAGGIDAGGLDAGGLDAGGLDAGGLDAGGLDAGGLDAGGLDARVYTVGCGCNSMSPSMAGVIFVFFCLFWTFGNRLSPPRPKDAGPTPQTPR